MGSVLAVNRVHKIRQTPGIPEESDWFGLDSGRHQ